MLKRLNIEAAAEIVSAAELEQPTLCSSFYSVSEFGSIQKYIVNTPGQTRKKSSIDGRVGFVMFKSED